MASIPPIWAISHMCNSPAYIQESVNLGANAVECDVECKQMNDDFEFVVHHGFAGPGYPHEKAYATTPLNSFLDELAKISRTTPHFALQYFDCKIPDGLSDSVLSAMGKALATRISSHLFECNTPTELYCVVNCASTEKAAFLNFASAPQETIPPRIGVTIDQFGTPSEVGRVFRSQGLSKLGWYTHGNNILQPLSGIIPSLKEAVKDKEKGEFTAVGAWTINDPSSLAELLNLGVTSIMCDTDYTPPFSSHSQNGITNLLNIVNNSQSIRLANRSDNPFSVGL